MAAVTERLAAALADRYRIERELGAGGMATVYLAEDLKHDRKVALKVLKPELAAVLGAERFVVEIKTTASLSHPHILPLFDSGTADGFLFYVMPFVDGETLRDRLNRETQLGVEESIRIASDVASALHYAHAHGVIHRDIKPENILLHDGRPMVADFGIALAVSAAAGGRMTETGLSLGTPHYMSPEQATAEKEINGRSDVYSLASVLYEMLAGEPPHGGGSAQQIIMKIITEQAQPVTARRRSVPPNVSAALSKALEKLPADRFATAAGFAEALNDRGFTTLTTAAGYVPLAGQRTWRGWIRDPRSWAVLAFAGALAGWALQPAPAPRTIRVSVAIPEAEQIHSTSTRRFAISRDGARIVYVGPAARGTRLWIREMDALTARPLDGTEAAQAPFFSPDGMSIGFFTGNPGDLRTMSVRGGASVVVVRDSASPWGGDWGDDGRILFSHASARVARVPAEGGVPEIVSRLDSSRGVTEHDWPQLLPGGKKVLLQMWKGTIADATVGVLDLATGDVTEVIQAAYGRYTSSGHVLYSTFSGKMAMVPLDVRRSALSGAAITLDQTVAVDVLSGAGQFDLSSTGLMLYMPGVGVGIQQVVWVDRAGRAVPVDSGWRGSFSSLSLSPDGTRVAVAVISDGGTQIWVKRLPTGPFAVATSGANSNDRPAWMPDGRRLAFISSRSGIRGAWMQRSDASAPAESLLVDSRVLNEIQPTPDGRSFVVRMTNGWDLFTLTPGREPVLRPLVVGPAPAFGADVSPDGRWLAYVGAESGRGEVYVRRLDDPDASRVQVSIDGAAEPKWAHNGRELFFRSPRGEMLVAELTLGATAVAQSPRVLFTMPTAVRDLNHRAYDVSLDDQRLLMIKEPESSGRELVLVTNWFSALMARSAAVKP